MIPAYGAAVELPKPFLVAIGAIAGATVRWAIAEAVDHHFWSLTLVNSVGAALLGALVIFFRDADATPRLLLGVGFCGALTTFSTLAYEVAVRLDAGNAMDALVFAVATTAIGIGAGYAGVSTGRSLRR